MSASGIEMENERGPVSAATRCTDDASSTNNNKCDVTPTSAPTNIATACKRDCDQSPIMRESNNNNNNNSNNNNNNNNNNIALAAPSSNSTGVNRDSASTTTRSSTASCDGDGRSTSQRASADLGAGAGAGSCQQCTELRCDPSAVGTRVSPSREICTHLSVNPEANATGNSTSAKLHLGVRDRRSGSSQDGGPSPSPSASLGTTPASTPEPPRRPSAPSAVAPPASPRGASESDSAPTGMPRRERASVPSPMQSSNKSRSSAVRPAIASHKLSLVQARSHSHERELDGVGEMAASCSSNVTDESCDARTDGADDELPESPLKRTQSVMSTPGSAIPAASPGGASGGGGVSPSSSSGANAATCACAASGAHPQLHERLGKKASATQVAPEDNPNYDLCKRLETLVTRMFDETTGVPVRTVKNFISRIPSVFTGADLVAWISKNVNVADHAEALHLACMLAAHGYLFPVDDHVLTVKPDNTYYRFQTPCLWPSRCDPPENVDYAVYLCKRTMQSRPRNELMDYEAESLARLQKTLNRKWELIYMQAEAQAKVDRKREKQQREVLDSQERAFWDLHRPVPNAVSTMEVDMRKALRKYKPSARLRDPVAAFVNTNVSEQQVFKDARDRVYRLTKLLDRHRIKVSKVAETLISRGEQYAPFDALITQPDPSNPWVTDNQEYWEMEKCRTDIALRRVQKWSFSLLELIKDPAGHEQFEKFLEREFSKENLKFWEACVRLKYAPVREIAERMRAIYVQFLAPGAAEAVNVDSKIQETVNKKLSVLYSDRYVFEDAEDHIYQLMNRDSYCRFLRSEQYKELLRTAKPPRNVALSKRKTTEATGSSGSAGNQQAAGGTNAGVGSSSAIASGGAGKSQLHATKSSAPGDLKDASKDASSV